MLYSCTHTATVGVEGLKYFLFPDKHADKHAVDIWNNFYGHRLRVSKSEVHVLEMLL